MKNKTILVLGITLLAVCAAACGWKPEVTAVPLTAPWTAMNLPIKENAVVWSSTDKEFKAVHKDNKKTVLKNYTEALKAAGWELVKFDEPTDRYVLDMKKGAENIEVEIYDFNNTGVIIKTGAAMSDNPTAPTTTKTSTDTTAKTGDSPKIEKADFTVTSEELDKAFNKKGVKSEDLEKYASKIIHVTGRVSTLVTEKKGTTQPWVTLYAPGVLAGVSCYFDDSNLEQMKQLKMDKVVKVQGFMSSLVVPEVSPMLDHCVVIEGAN